jgi:hypothetical protein
MNPLKHMELIFGLVVTAGLLMAAAADRNASAAAPAPATAAASTSMPTTTAANGAVPQPVARAGMMAVVIVKGKRMSSREKRRAAVADGPLRIF